MPLPTMARRQLRLRRRAVVGLVAGAVAVVAIPASASTSAGASAGPRLAARHAHVASAWPARPKTPHRHHDIARRSLATINTNSKRDGGHVALVAPAVRVVPVADSGDHGVLEPAPVGAIGSAFAARAPPAGQ